MAYYHHSLLAFAFILSIVFSTMGQTIAGRDVLTNAEKLDKKQPEFLHHDPTVLVPGFGRYMHPKKSFHCKNALRYNTVTGTCQGNGLPVPGRGSSGGARRGFVPGGDDTNVPNPGIEVPIPGNGGQIPAPSRP